jgi:hypothetical protein
MSIPHALLLALGTLLLGAGLTTYFEDRLQYNLWDWLRDHYRAFRGYVVHDTQVIIKLSASEYHHLTDALDKIPAAIKWAIRRR